MLEEIKLSDMTVIAPSEIKNLLEDNEPSNITGDELS